MRDSVFHLIVPRRIPNRHACVTAGRHVRWFAPLLALVLLAVGQAAATDVDQRPMRQARGQTMGTVYDVKIFDPPADLPEDWKSVVDRELRRVNDQMSTYLESSELSRFNQSDSTQWFGVSSETARVVSRALQIHEASDGAFDVTIFPLVSAWHFGPGERTNAPPTQARIDQLLPLVGSQWLEVRHDPPALRKQRSELTVDLSAIAKGHGVDRVVGLLRNLGATNVFVDIGGDLRVTGDKGGEPWRIGIQQPDVQGTVVAIAHPLRDAAMATSGDYRNFFEHQGRRYSHTIDPRTGRPVEHAVASVTVIAEDCMTADAWATALNVLGADAGMELAQRLGIDALMMVRDDDGGLTTLGSGSLASVAASDSAAAATNANPPGNPDQDANRDRQAENLPTLQAPGLRTAVTAAVFFLIVIVAMAIGVIFGRRSISGSCGGLAGQRDADGNTSCSLCSNPEEACQRLREKVEQH